MKVSITFSELGQDQAYDLITYARDNYGPSLEPSSGPKRKRKRRTKEQMREAEPAPHEAEDAKTTEEDEPAPRRRKKKRGTVDVGPEVAVANLKRGRKKRGEGTNPTPARSVGRRKKARAKNTVAPAASPSDDEITDEDVMKVASEGAQHLTPKFIVDKLAEFGAAMVNDLSQEQRREFVDAVQAALEEEMR